MSEQPKPVTYDVSPGGEITVGNSAPYDGKEYLLHLKNHEGWAQGRWIEAYEDLTTDGFFWSFLDDKFNAEFDEVDFYLSLPVFTTVLGSYTEEFVRKPQKMKWQLIVVAPKDGTEILLAAQYTYTGHWDMVVGEWLGKRWPSVGQDQPTHWMPLPAPPGKDG